MTDKQKIIQYLDFKGISKNKFYLKTGFSVGFLDSGSSLGVDKLKIIIDNYPDFNPDWLLTGKGEMLKKEEYITNNNEIQEINLVSELINNDHHSKAIQRLCRYIEYKGITEAVFERDCGLSSGYLSINKKQNVDIEHHLIRQIGECYHDLSLDWLMTGNGSMLKNDQILSSEPMEREIVLLRENNDLLKKQIKYLEKEIEELKELISSL